MPHSRSGKLSMMLAVGAVSVFGVFFALVATGQKGGDTFFSNPWLAGTMTVAAFGAIAGSGAGIYAIAREGERSVVVFLTTAFGLLVLAYSTVEIVIPH